MLPYQDRVLTSNVKNRKCTLNQLGIYDTRDRDMVSVVNDLKAIIDQKVQLKSGTSISFTGQFELLERANQKLKLMVPTT